MYTTKNYRTKKELKEAVARGEKISYYEPGIGKGQEPKEGSIFLEGPHFPEPHKWYAEAEVKNGYIIKVR